MKKVTAWLVWNKKDKKFKHNHLCERGWITSDIPEPKFSSQKGWLGLMWKKIYCYLNDDRMVMDSIEKQDATNKGKENAKI